MSSQVLLASSVPGRVLVPPESQYLGVFMPLLYQKQNKCPIQKETEKENPPTLRVLVTRISQATKCSSGKTQNPQRSREAIPRRQPPPRRNQHGAKPSHFHFVLFCFVLLMKLNAFLANKSFFFLFRFAIVQYHI